MKHLALIALLTTACTTPEFEPTRVAILVMSGAPIDSANAFSLRMQRDMAMWNDALVERGCEPAFEYVQNLYDADVRIELRNKSQWPFRDNSIGAQFADSILVLSQADGTLDAFIDDPMWIVGLHELGHTLGLDHSVYTDSLMQSDGGPTALPLSRRDGDDAARALGCWQ